MGVIKFLTARVASGQNYSKAVRNVGVWKKVWKGNQVGGHFNLEKDKDMSRLIQIGSSPINIAKYILEKSNQNLLVTGATGQGKSKLVHLILEMFSNPKVVFSFKENDEYLHMPGNIISADTCLPDPFSDPEAFTSAFAVAGGLTTEGIQANTATSLVRKIAAVSKSWDEFIKNVKKMEKSRDHNTKAAATYILNKTENLAYSPNQAELDLNKTTVIDFSPLNEEAKTFYAELFLRQINKLLRHRSQSEPKVIVCVDEAHRLTKNVNVRYSSIFGEMAREIRAFGMLWTATQNLTDLPDTVRNNFGTQFCFNTTSEEDMRALSAVNRDLARCMSSLKKHEFADAKGPKLQDEILVYRADVSVLKERTVEERQRYAENSTKKPTMASALLWPPPEDRPTATQHAALMALYKNPDAEMRELAKYLKNTQWVTGDPTIYGSEGRPGVFESLVGLKLATKDNERYKLTVKGVSWVEPEKILAGVELGSDLHARLIKRTIKLLHEKNALVIAPKEKSAPDLIAYPMANGSKKYLWDDKKRVAYEIQTTARKENISANSSRNLKAGLKTCWVTYTEEILKEIKTLTENKGEYLLIQLK